MAEFDRLGRGTGWIGQGLWSASGHPSRSLKWVFTCTWQGVSLSNTKRELERLRVGRSRPAIHNWIQKADLQLASTATTNQIAVDETVIQVNDQRHWPYAAVDTGSNELLHVRLFHTRTTRLTIVVLRGLAEKHDLDRATVLVDDAAHLEGALERLGF